MKKMTRNIIIVGALIAIIGYSYYAGWLDQFIPATSNINDYVPSDVDKENYKNGIGRYNVFDTFVDSLDIGTVRTETTNYVIKWYTRQGELWQYKEVGNNKYVTLVPADGGYLWCIVTVPAGQAYYVDYAKTVQGNQYIKSYLYSDVDGDGVKEFAFQYDMKDQPIPNSGYPAVSFNGYLLTYDSSFTGLNDVSNDTAIGTATTTKYYSYYLSFSATKKGVALYKVEVKFTTTDETKCRLKKFNVPGLGNLDASQFDKQYTASDIRYVYTITNSFDNAIYIKYGTAEINRFDSTISIEYTLVHPDDILVTVTYYYLKGQTEAGGTTSDTFYAQE